VKASAFRRWPVTLGLIALVQTTRWTGGHDSEKEKHGKNLLDRPKKHV